MPKRTDIESILIIGAGPIVIGQACEFDYSGVQACRALKSQGYRVILINSNPATIMTDPDLVDATYIEPITWQVVTQIIEKEKPNALLPTMGGQTALNCALDLERQGILEIHGVELIGASSTAIRKAEDRAEFRVAMQKIGLDVPRSQVASNLNEALRIQSELGYPTIIRPSFTLGGSGGGIAYNKQEFISICEQGFQLSPVHELLIEESFLGWKEFEMEVVRDRRDNCIIVCGIENFDPMGIHTGDSITVAPIQTLTDKEYQQMRNASIAVLREIGVETGGANVQFAVEPHTGRQVIIEMNPRVSRSSALASKATGFPIAKIATLLAVGYTLDELKNDMTAGLTPASFEPTLDYVVTKIPRFNFDKFPQAEERLTTQMKSVGEVMSIAPTFQASLQKALSGLEVGLSGLDPQFETHGPAERVIVENRLKFAGPARILYIAEAFRMDFSVEDVHRLTSVDPWFLDQIQSIVAQERDIARHGIAGMTQEKLKTYKFNGFTDSCLARLLALSESTLRTYRRSMGITASYKRIDSCAAEFPAETAYLYSSYDSVCEALPTDRQKVMVLGGGPNRVGQGIEFDYCCVHAIQALRDQGFEAIMVNCNPETVSTDCDISDRLYFEPLTLESVLEIVEKEQPLGVIVQYGGQTPLRLANDLQRAGVRILGTSPDAIDRAEDRERFLKLICELGLQQPDNRTVTTVEMGLLAGKELGFPLVVRPSYVLGGRAMEIVHHLEELRQYLTNAVRVNPKHPVLLDRFLSNAIEVDIDAVADQEGEVFIAGIMEHVEQAGVHSGDSSCCIPPFSLSLPLQETLAAHMRLLTQELGVVGLINAQFAIQDGAIYVLEVNPRASRTVPFVSKAIGLPLSKIAACCIVGLGLEQQGIIRAREQSARLRRKSLIFEHRSAVDIEVNEQWSAENQGFTANIVGLSTGPERRQPSHYAVKHPVFPFEKFPGADPILGPEMKSTGEVMGFARTFPKAFSKGLLATGVQFKYKGCALISVKQEDKSRTVPLAMDLLRLGYSLMATRGTAEVLRKARIPCQIVNKVREGEPHIVNMIENNHIDFIVNTTEGRQSIDDSHAIRSTAVRKRINYTTTLDGANAIVLSLKEGQDHEIFKLQDLHECMGVY